MQETIRISLYIILGMYLIYCGITDIKDKSIELLPAVIIVLVGIAGGLIVDKFTCFNILCGIVVILIMLIVYKLSRGQIGLGDIIIFGILIVYYDIRTMLTIVFISLLLACVYSIILVAKRRRKLRTTIPFCPFIAISTGLYMCLFLLK